MKRPVLYIVPLAILLLFLLTRRDHEPTGEIEGSAGVDRKLEPIVLAESEDLKRAGTKIVSCMFSGNEMGNDFHREFVEIATKCMDQYLVIPKDRFLVTHVGRFSETKVFIDYPDKQNPSKDCSYLTIGIGGDIKAEEELKAKYPKCQLFGLDPVEREGNLFGKVGTFINAGLADKDGSEVMTVRMPNAGYSRQTAVVLSPKTFMEKVSLPDELKHSPEFHFHFGTIDIEGYEYILLQNLKGSWEQAGLRICQIDLELHGTFNNTQMGPKLRDWLHRFLSETRLIPVAVANHISVHRKVTLISPSLYCDRTFDFSVLLKRG